MKQTALCNLLGITYPVIQAPMAGGIITPNFVSKVSDFGMLGSIPAGYLDFSTIQTFITSVTTQTSKPFLLNIFVDYEEYGLDTTRKPNEIVELEQSLDILYPEEFSIPNLPTVSDTLYLAINHNVPIISTTFGVPSYEDMQLIKDNNITLLITVNSAEEAKIALLDYEADAIVYQNDQAGGHKGGFLENGYSNAADIIAIKGSCPEAIFIKSGGITGKQDIDNALEQGFDGVQIGTSFLMTEESTASALHKEEIAKTDSVKDIVSAPYITGKLATGIKNKLTLLSHQSSLGYPLLHYATIELRAHAKKTGEKEYQSLWAGKSAAKINKVEKLTKYMQSLI